MDESECLKNVAKYYAQELDASVTHLYIYTAEKPRRTACQQMCCMYKTGLRCHSETARWNSTERRHLELVYLTRRLKTIVRMLLSDITKVHVMPA